jgi:hypothetical protein
VRSFFTGIKALNGAMSSLGDAWLNIICAFRVNAAPPLLTMLALITARLDS